MPVEKKSDIRLKKKYIRKNRNQKLQEKMKAYIDSRHRKRKTIYNIISFKFKNRYYFFSVKQRSSHK